MNIFSLSSLIAAVVCFFLSYSVINQNRKTALNRVFAVFCLLLAYWAFCEFMLRVARDSMTAYLWLKLSVLWHFAIALSLHFMFVFTKRWHLLKNKLSLFLLYSSAAIFTLIDLLTNKITGGPVKEYWGYTYTTPLNDLVYWLDTLWAVGIVFVAFILCVIYYSKADNKKNKRQAKCMAIGISIPIFVGLTTEAILPAISIRVPELTASTMTLMCVFIGYAILRYELFVITPANVAENIISTMADSLILLDTDGIITKTNESLLTLLGYKENEIIGESVEILFRAKDHFRQKILEELFINNPLTNFATKYVAKSGKEIDVSLSASLVRDKETEIAGIVCTASNITEQRRMENELAKHREHLEELVVARTEELKTVNEQLLREISEHKQTAERLSQSYKNLQRTLLQAVSSLASALEKKDTYTAGHQYHVTRLADEIAKEMGLSERQIDGLHVAGLLHDIGKICIPIEILTKPTKLTEPEFSIIKTHPRVGQEILQPIDFPWPVAHIVHQHHERMNGSGYPQMLSGENILIEARILGVADVVVAMSSHRPYRRGLGIGKALKEILKNKGILYDPQVVDACLRVFKKKRFK